MALPENHDMSGQPSGGWKNVPGGSPPPVGSGEAQVRHHNHKQWHLVGIRRRRTRGVGVVWDWGCVRVVAEPP